MRLVTYARDGMDEEGRAGVLMGELIVDLERAAAWARRERGLRAGPALVSVLGLVQGGAKALDYARDVLERVRNEAQGTEWALPMGSARLLAPIRPVSLRDGYAFEQHVRKASENRGRPVPEQWYKAPAFYYTNALTVIGHEAGLRTPRYTKALDYELEIAAIIGKAGVDLELEEAAEHIFGFTIFNDWSARDVQMAEMKLGLGPAKGKDFASTLGPCIVTLDELADRATGRPGVFDLEMAARINGVERSRANLRDIYWSFGEIIARISNEAPIAPGEVVGSGTVGTGCLLEMTRGEGPWLEPGDVVELEVERIGVLRNEVLARAEPKA